MTYNLITILGPTAVGKTRLGALLAHKFNGEIISADSRQVYKGMDIGTGKDLNDYKVDGKNISYHLIDIVDPDSEFNLYSFNRHFFEAYEKIIKNNKIPFLVGGTGLYLHSILNKYSLQKVNFDEVQYEELNKLEIPELRKLLAFLNPKLHNTTDLLIKDRIIKAIIVARGLDKVEEKKSNINSLNLGVRVDRETVKTNITKRLKYRLEHGMIEEVEKLVADGISFDKLEFFGLEYKSIARYLKSEISYEELFEQLNIAIRQFAKRQMTWYRKMEKEGIKIYWIDGADYDSAEIIIIENYFV